MLVEPVGHLLQPEPDVFEADLLAHDVERQGAEPAVHLAHHPGEHRAVAHPGIEDAQRRGLGMNMGQLHAGAFGDHPLLAAGVDEHQVFLPVVVEPEGRAATLGCAPTLGRGRWPGSLERAGLAEPCRGCMIALARRRAFGQVPPHPLDRPGRHALAVTQPADELAVIDHLAPEGRLGNAGVAAEGLYLADQILLGVHCTSCAEPVRFWSWTAGASVGQTGHGKNIPKFLKFLCWD